MTETLIPMDQEPTTETDHLATELDTYLTNYYARLHPEVADTGQFLQEIKANTLTVMHRNNEVARILKSDDYKKIAEREKELKGPCAVNMDICIDGRIPNVHLIGLSGNIWETGAGVVELRESSLDGQAELESVRLTEAVIERTQKEQPQMLQILTAHTSLSEQRNLAKNGFHELPSHGCGRMVMLYNEGAENGTPFDSKDLVAQNLSIHAQSAEAFTNLYNRAAEVAGKEPLKQTAMCAVYDTDTMGLLLEYGTDHELFTTDITRMVTDSPIEAELASEVGKPGSMRDTFTDERYLQELAQKVLASTEILMDDPSLTETFNTYINIHFPDFTKEQKQSLRFTLTKNVAFQRITGVFDLDQESHAQQHESASEHTHSHPFVHHGEGYQSISMDGVIVGEFDPGQQVFGATVATPEEAILHIKIQSSLMDKIQATQPPYLLFISKAVSNGGTPDTIERDRGTLRSLFREIENDEEIQKMIKSGKLVPVPVLIDSKSREIQHIAKELAI